ATVDGLPPFQGGAAGLLGYELGRSLERLPTTRYDEFEIPALAIGCYDVVLAWDHGAGRAWIISQGLPEREPALRAARAQARLAEFRGWLETPNSASALRRLAVGSPLNEAPRRNGLAPQFAVSQIVGLTSNFSRDEYLNAVRRAIEYIYAGDIFQV